MFEEAEYINCALFFDLLQHTVYDDVRPCPTHSSTATQHSKIEEQQGCRNYMVSILNATSHDMLLIHCLHQIPTSFCPLVEVSLGKTLNPKFLPMVGQHSVWKLAAIGVCVIGWMSGKNLVKHYINVAILPFTFFLVG